MDAKLNKIEFDKDVKQMQLQEYLSLQNSDQNKLKEVGK